MTVDLTSSMTWVVLEAILFALLLISTPTSTFREFHAIMNLKRMRDSGVKLSRAVTILSAYLLARGYFLDFLMNTIHLSVQMREFPRWDLGEWVVTGRVTRLKIHGSARQRAIAEWYCGPAGLQLNDGDPSGCHCQ